MGIDAKTGLILLAAGRASRFGGEKLAARFNGRPLVQWAIGAAEQAGFARKALVVRERASIAAPEGWQTIVNPDADQGQSTSIKVGVQALRDCERIVVTLGDMPFVPADHLQRLAAARGPVFTRYPGGRRGCPAAFPASAYGALLALDGDRGAASLCLADASEIQPHDPDMLADIDTAADIERLYGAGLAMPR